MFVKKERKWQKFHGSSLELWLLLRDNIESCSSSDKSTWQEVRHEKGISTSPRQRCSMGDGEERCILRYSTVSWSMRLPCLSRQWKEPTKKRPSLTPTRRRRKSSFRTTLTAGVSVRLALKVVSSWRSFWGCWWTEDDDPWIGSSISGELGRTSPASHN